MTGFPGPRIPAQNKHSVDVGKNFDRTWRFGPVFLSCPAGPTNLPAGAARTEISTRPVEWRTRGTSDDTANMIFSIGQERCPYIIRGIQPLGPRYVIGDGNPSRGWLVIHSPHQKMARAGDTVEVRIEGIVRFDPVVDEGKAPFRTERALDTKVPWRGPDHKQGPEANCAPDPRECETDDTM